MLPSKHLYLSALIPFFANALFGAVFEEIDGIVSMEAEHYTEKTGTWVERDAASGIALLHYDGCQGHSDEYLMYEVTFTNTGMYWVWGLSKWGGWNGADDLKVWIDTPSSQVNGSENKGRDYEFSTYNQSFMTGDWYAPGTVNIGKDPWGWSNNAKDKEKVWPYKHSGGNRSARWIINEPGKHTIHFVKGHEPEHCGNHDGNPGLTLEEQAFGIDKIVCILDGSTGPEGLGPDETIAGQTSSQMKKKQRYKSSITSSLTSKYISIENVTPGDFIQILSLQGKMIQSQNVVSSGTVELTLSKGLYLCLVERNATIIHKNTIIVH